MQQFHPNGSNSSSSKTRTDDSQPLLDVPKMSNGQAKLLNGSHQRVVSAPSPWTTQDWSFRLRDDLLAPSSNLDPLPHSVTSSLNQVLDPSEGSSHSQNDFHSRQSLADSKKAGSPTNNVLYLGDLESWMQNLEYISHCTRAMGWDRDMVTGKNLPVAIEAKIMKGSASGATGYCFLTFQESEQAQAVMRLFEAEQQRTLMPGSDRIFKLNWSTGSAGTRAVFDKEYSVFVRDLPKDVTEGELVALFASRFSTTRSAKLMTDPVTGASKTYGFVRFGDVKDSLAALATDKVDSQEKLMLRGQMIRISEASVSGAYGTGGSRSRPNGDVQSRPTLLRQHSDQSPVSATNFLHHDDPNYAYYRIPAGESAWPLPSSKTYSNADQQDTIFVGNLPYQATEQDLRLLFESFGPITRVKIPPNKGCGFVTFTQTPHAERAFIRLQGFPLHGSTGLRLSWARTSANPEQRLSEPYGTNRKLPNGLLGSLDDDTDLLQQKASTLSLHSNEATSNNTSSSATPHSAYRHSANIDQLPAGNSNPALLRRTNIFGLEQSDLYSHYSLGPNPAPIWSTK